MVNATLSNVLAEHADEASFLWLQRASAVHAPNYDRRQFADLDERLAAHVDGLRTAGDAGWEMAQAALDNEAPEDFFAAAVLAAEKADTSLDALIDRGDATSDVVPGLISALGWVSPQFLGGRVKSLLQDGLPLRQKLGVAACALHRRDPGEALGEVLDRGAVSVRTRALRAAGELGRTDLIQPLREAMGESRPEPRFWGAWSAVLLGDRLQAIEALAAVASRPGPRQMGALQLALQAMEGAAGHALLTELSTLPGAQRLRIIGSGFVGDARYAPWLIDQMANPAVARIAAEAFVCITGADFDREQMEVPPPDGFEDGPTEDPDDENVEPPEDIALPWPDVKKIRSWWDRHGARFASGSRYFLGQPVTPDHCVKVLREGFQRQRVAAALHLALLRPGSVLFATSAPAWRQQRWLRERA